MKRHLTSKGPGWQAGAGNLEAAAIKHSDPLDRLFGRQTQFLIDPHPIEPFHHYRDAARALLAIESLSEKQGQFCGGLAYRSAPLSDKQANWLRSLLAHHDLPALAEGGAHG